MGFCAAMSMSYSLQCILGTDEYDEDVVSIAAEVIVDEESRGNDDMGYCA